MNKRKIKTITDDLVGQDEKICSCSARIAELLKSSENKNNKEKNLFKRLWTTFALKLKRTISIT